ncbi:MAG: hypothetical protein ACR2P6_01030 [Gammaproteobacteria bacterium]
MTDNNTSNDRLARRSSRLLREANDHLDGPTLSRLNRARQMALQHIAEPVSASSAWLPAGLLATAALVLAVVWYQPRSGADQGVIEPFIAQAATDLSEQDVDLLLAEDDIDLFAELDFYRALDSDSSAILLDEMDFDWSS